MSTTGKRSLQMVHRIRSGRKTARCKCAPAEQTPQIQERRRFTADIRRDRSTGNGKGTCGRKDSVFGQHTPESRTRQKAFEIRWR